MYLCKNTADRKFTEEAELKEEQLTALLVILTRTSTLCGCDVSEQ